MMKNTETEKWKWMLYEFLCIALCILLTCVFMEINYILKYLISGI